MMGWDYVSELWPPSGLLFIPQVMCEHGEPWWWWCQLGITPDSSTRALCQSYQQRHLEKVGRMDEGVRILPIRIWNISRDLQHAVKSWDFQLYFQSEGKCAVDFLSPLKIHCLGRLWTRDPWVQWQAVKESSMPAEKFENPWYRQLSALDWQPCHARRNHLAVSLFCGCVVVLVNFKF
jgi:hypothetical protein